MPMLYPNDRLRDIRVSRKLTQEELAKQIGTTALNISRWERGETFPHVRFVSVLCGFFEMLPGELGLASHSHVISPSKSTLLDPLIPLWPQIGVVGRSNELVHLKSRLFASGNTRITALNGIPGVGKTTLAIALAHDSEVQAYFCDGILWAGLGPHPDITGILRRWGTIVGLSFKEMATLIGVEAWAKALFTAIGKRNILLVIDDVWLLEEALALKVGGPNCSYLVTTRFPGIASGLTIDSAIAIQELGNSDGMELLKTLAPVAVEREEQWAHRLVQAVGGLPLALTLMGNYLRIQSYSGSTRRINTAFERLGDAEGRLQLSEPLVPGEHHPSLLPETSLSLQVVIATTDQQLSDRARVALYALSVFPAKPQSCTEEAALAVAICPVEILDELVDAGLLESSGAERYTLHQTIADYARAQLHDRAVYERFVTYCAGFVRSHGKDYEELERESEMLLAGLESAYEIGMQAELAQTVCQLAPFLLRHGAYSIAEQQLQRAHEAAVAIGDNSRVIITLLYLGEVAQKQNNFAYAEGYYQEGLALARQIKDDERVSALLNNLGWMSLKRGEYTLAETYLQEGLALAHQINHYERLSSILETLGSLAGTQGSYSQSEVYLQESLAHARLLGDPERICTILINLGVTAGEQGEDTQAEIYFQEGLTLARQIGHREWISLLLINLGGMAIEQDDFIRAETYLQEALVLVRQAGIREWLIALLTNLGLVARKRKNYPLAEEYFQESLILARQIDVPQLTGNILYEYGNLHLDLQQLEIAKGVFQELIETMSKVGKDLVALAAYGLARVASAQEDIRKARRLGESSFFILKVIGHRKAREVRSWLDTTIVGIKRDSE